MEPFSRGVRVSSVLHSTHGPMKHDPLGFLRTNMVGYVFRGPRRRVRVMVVACIFLEVLAITAFVTGVVVVFSLFERV